MGTWLPAQSYGCRYNICGVLQRELMNGESGTRGKTGDSAVAAGLEG